MLEHDVERIVDIESAGRAFVVLRFHNRKGNLILSRGVGR